MLQHGAVHRRWYLYWPTPTHPPLLTQTATLVAPGSRRRDRNVIIKTRPLPPNGEPSLSKISKKRRKSDFPFPPISSPSSEAAFAFQAKAVAERYIPIVGNRAAFPPLSFSFISFWPRRLPVFGRLGFLLSPVLFSFCIREKEEIGEFYDTPPLVAFRPSVPSAVSFIIFSLSNRPRASHRLSISSFASSSYSCLPRTRKCWLYRSFAGPTLGEEPGSRNTLSISLLPGWMSQATARRHEAGSLDSQTAFPSQVASSHGFRPFYLVFGVGP